MNSFSIAATTATHSVPSGIKVDPSLWMVALFSGTGLLVSAFVLTFGGDIGAVLLY
jgi:hypothetical protein